MSDVEKDMDNGAVENQHKNQQQDGKSCCDGNSGHNCLQLGLIGWMQASFGGAGNTAESTGNTGGM